MTQDMCARALGRVLPLFTRFASASALLVAGCASTAHTGVVRQPNAERGESTAAPRTAPTAADASAPAGTAGRTEQAAPRPSEFVLDPKLPLRPLPELKVENIGLHIGGGPNDPRTKAPFLSAIGDRFPAFMDCYRKSEDPAQGGRFGIDLHIGRSGGHPELEQPRTALRGAEFRSCLHRVFESIEFQKPERGPTTISYSLRFVLVEAP